MENKKDTIAETFNQSLLTMWRFPVSILCSVALFTICFLQNHVRNFGIEFPEFGLLISALICAFVSASIVNVYLHSKDGRIRFYHHLMACLVAGMMGIAIYYSPLLRINAKYFNIALMLLFLITPIMFFDISEDATWKHIGGITGGFFLSIIIGIAIGIAAWLFGWALKVLLGYHKLINNPLDILIMVFCLAIPIVSLYLLPNLSKAYLQFPDTKTLSTRSYTFLMNYFLPPFIVLVWVILNYYTVPINSTWPLAKDIAAHFVVTFLLMLAGFVFIKKPWKNSAITLTKWLINLGALLYLTLIVMLAIVTFRYISYDGFTPHYYVLFITGLWLVVLFVSSIFKREKLSSISFLTSLTIILLFTSFGPWGMDGISIKSQKTRFMRLLNKYELVENGRLIQNYKDKFTFTSDETKSAYSIFDFLSKYNRLDSLEPLFEGHEDNPFHKMVGLEKDEAIYKMRRAFNPNIINDEYVFSQNIKFSSEALVVTDPAMKGKLYGKLTPNYYQNYQFQDEGKKLVAWIDEEYLHTRTPMGTWKIELKLLEERFKPLSGKKGVGLERYVTHVDGQKLEYLFKIFNLRRTRREALDIMNTEYSLIVYQDPS